MGKNERQAYLNANDRLNPHLKADGRPAIPWVAEDELMRPVQPIGAIMVLMSIFSPAR
jgi:hypothetical protein